MECETCREALSARMDGEAEPVPAERTDRHLAECAACRAWQARAIEVSRAARVREATPTPDLTATVLAAAPGLIHTRGGWTRLALGGVAIAQLSLGLAQVLGVTPTAQHVGHDAGALSGHLFNESTAWNLALGVGLFWTAFRPGAARGLLPVVAAFVALLTYFATHDLITGAAPVSRIAGHGLLIAGLVLLLVVHRQHRDPAPGRPDVVAEPEPGHTETEHTDSDGPEPDERHHPLRPVGRHRVA